MKRYGGWDGASRPRSGGRPALARRTAPAPTVRLPGQEGARRGAKREPPLLRQAPVRRGPRAQVQELLPRGGPGSLQRVSDSWPRVRQTARAGELSSQEEGSCRPNGVTKQSVGQLIRPLLWAERPPGWKRNSSTGSTFTQNARLRSTSQPLLLVPGTLKMFVSGWLAPCFILAARKQGEMQ